MGYLKDFRWDVFLSYAHVDNDKPETKSRGWVTRFRDELNDALQKRSKREVTVFWDTDLRANQQFTPAIKAAIGGSALLVVLTSRRYLSSAYCKDEVEWFSQKAAKDPYGMVLDPITYQTRLFNVRLYDIPYPEWLPPLRGQNEYEFFAPARSDSSAGPVSAERLNRRVQKLADDIIKTLEEMDGKRAESDSRVRTETTRSRDTFSVYVAKVNGSLVPHQEAVLDMLAANKIDVLGPSQTEDLARQLISKAQVSVHLLNGFTDSGVERQFELGRDAPRQLIWLARKVDLKKDGLSSFEQKLLALENDTRSDRNYELMSGENFAEDIVGAVKRQKCSWDEATWERDQSQDLFIDVRDNDRSHAVQLFDYLSSQEIPPTTIQRYPDQPTDEAFSEHVRRAKAIVFFYGSINREVLEARLNDLTEVVRLRRRPIEMVSVFAAPPPVKTRADIRPLIPIDIKWMDNTSGFDPATLRDLVDLFTQSPRARP
jgi:hypothetical protein